MMTQRINPHLIDASTSSDGTDASNVGRPTAAALEGAPSGGGEEIRQQCQHQQPGLLAAVQIPPRLSQTLTHSNKPLPCIMHPIPLNASITPLAFHQSYRLSLPLMGGERVPTRVGEWHHCAL